MKADVTCTLCAQPATEYVVQKKPQGGKPGVYKCVPCNRLNTRTSVMLDKLNMKEQWCALPKDKKVSFFQAAHAYAGEQLKAEITQTVERFFRQSQSTAFEGNGVWVDEDDLNDRFKNKPDQLKSIKERANTMDDPVRGVKLYEVIEYKSQLKQQTEVENRISLGVETVSKQKGTKRQLADGGETGARANVKKEKPVPELTDAATKRLEKLKARIAGSVKVWEDTMSSVEADVIPQKLADKITVGRAEVGAVEAEIDVALDTKKGKVSDIVKAAMQALEKFDSVVDVVAKSAE